MSTGKRKSVLSLGEGLSHLSLLVHSLASPSSPRFNTCHFHFLPIATIERNTGRPWATFLAHPTGEFIEVTNPRQGILVVNAKAVDGDPALDNLTGEKPLIAGGAVDSVTERYNKMGGHLVDIKRDTNKGTVQLHVRFKESLSNCPKYLLKPRVFEPRTHLSLPQTVLNERHATGPLPTSLITFIHARDTLYFSLPGMPAANSPNVPRLALNQRGGLPGFCRVAPPLSSTSLSQIFIPDHSRNGLLSSLGTLAGAPKAGLAWADWKSGNVLYVTGEAEDLYGGAAEAVMPRVKCVTRVTVTGYVFIKGGLPVREVEGAKPPGSGKRGQLVLPGVRYLTVEPALLGSRALKRRVAVSLVAWKMHPAQGQKECEADVATLTFLMSEPLQWQPGQFVVVDCKGLGGVKTTTKHGKDDDVRTWTITSIPSPPGTPPLLSITVRAIPSGRITPKLVDLARTLSASASPLQKITLNLSLIAIGGAFVLPPFLPPPSHFGGQPPTPTPMLFLAGGIGITRFLVILRALRANGERERGRQVGLWISCKASEEGMFLRLVNDSLALPPKSIPGGEEEKPAFDLEVRTYISPAASSTKYVEQFGAFEIRRVKGRLTAESALVDGEGGDREMAIRKGAVVYVCGPAAFEDAAVMVLGELGVPEGQVKRECQF